MKSGRNSRGKVHGGDRSRSKTCVYRESAIAALNKAGRAWRLVFESSSMAGCLSAARSDSPASAALIDAARRAGQKDRFVQRTHRS